MSPTKPASSEMKYRSSFSYKNDNVNVVRFGRDINMRMERVNNDVARIYFVDDRGTNIQIPNGFVLRDNIANVNVRPLLNNGFGNYFTSWISNYSLLRNGIEMFALSNQKQQSVEGLDGFRYYTINR
ncbi:6799_t:CDS:1 [Paraglomus brasilianum]|uniref:6799_t:CDS:1 n=1 Tax=Paraglomus brasilianum TaxID=144538 RepID=A0A9N8VI32_9GLOM|nr:6799_t:CDS:1 [Paraglomus brasilianum]